MVKVPKKDVERFRDAVPKFQKVLKIALDRDINEADTVTIVQDMLAEIFGFDKFLDVTSEYAIRGTYCDLAIKLEDKIQYLIEVKAIGIALKEPHLKQVIDYGANRGVKWVVLTNGVQWQLHAIKFERPISAELVASFDFLDINPRKEDHQAKLHLLSKRGLAKSAREEYYEKVQSVNRFVVSALLLSPPVLTVLRRDIKKLSAGIKVETDEIEKILRTEVLKRDALEGDEAAEAMAKVKKLHGSNGRKNRHKTPHVNTIKEPDEKSEKESITDRLLREAAESET